MINFDECLEGNYANPSPCIWTLAAILHYPAQDKIVLLNELGYPRGSDEDTPESRERATYYLRLTPDMIRYLFWEYKPSEGEKPNRYDFAGGSQFHPVLAGIYSHCGIREGGKLRRAVLLKFCEHRTLEALERDYEQGIDAWFERHVKRLLTPLTAYILAKIRYDYLDAGISEFTFHDFLDEYQETEFARCWPIQNTKQFRDILTCEVFMNIAKALGLRWHIYFSDDGTGKMEEIKVVGFDDI